jgi:hypothetical protein
MLNWSVMIKKWTLNVLISLDQLLNTVFGGDPDETISSRLGKLKVRHGIIPWYRPLAKTLDYLLDAVDENHCIDAIERDEGKDALYD